MFNVSKLWQFLKGKKKYKPTFTAEEIEQLLDIPVLHTGVALRDVLEAWNDIGWHSEHADHRDVAEAILSGLAGHPMYEEESVYLAKKEAAEKEERETRQRHESNARLLADALKEAPDVHPESVFTDFLVANTKDVSRVNIGIPDQQPPLIKEETP